MHCLITNMLFFSSTSINKLKDTGFAFILLDWLAVNLKFGSFYV